MSISGERDLQGGPPPVWVDDAKTWRRLEEELRTCRRMAVDLEADGFHHYGNRVCLIQLAVGGRIFLLDPLALRSLETFGDALEDPEVEVIFHSADYDIRSLDRDFGFRVRNLFDTSVGAAFLGEKFLGLGTVTKELIGIDLPKSKRLQRSDWSRRPLPEEALGYAAADVAHLVELADLIQDRLGELGRREWVREECSRLETVRFAVPPPPVEAFLKAKGVFALTPGERAVYRELYLFREDEAQRLDLPPFKVLGNDVMLQLARTPDVPLDSVKGVSSRFLDRAGPGLRRAVRAGVLADPIPLPRRAGDKPSRRLTAAGKERLQLLKEWRRTLGETLGLDQSLVWPLSHLEWIALDAETGKEQAALATDVKTACGVRRWQDEEFGPDLAERVVSSLRRQGG